MQMYCNANVQLWDLNSWLDQSGSILIMDKKYFTCFLFVHRTQESLANLTPMRVGSFFTVTSKKFWFAFFEPPHSVSCISSSQLSVPLLAV